MSRKDQEKSQSRFGLFFEGWAFRTRTPDFEIGDEFSSFVTGYDENMGVPLVRVGDSFLQLEGSEEDEGRELIDTRVRLRVEEYDPDTHTGKAIMLERLGKETY